MSSTNDLRSRRSVAELHALAGVEREIRAQDSNGRRKYLRDFSQAFGKYEALLDSEQIQNALLSADVVLVGDYHALPAAQRYAARLLEQRALAGDRPVVLGVETIFSRDQHVLDEWWRREIEETELRQRIRFDLDWGYEWAPFYELLATARDNGEGIYGLDCMPREDLRRIGARDRHASTKIAEIREKHPDAVIFVLFGESHLAPGHLPRLLDEQLPGVRALTVLQNIDSLYWRAAGESADKIEGVRVKDGVVCVFNATPLEKYESYRLFLDQWSRCESGPDFAPTVYNLIDSLASFLEINRYSPHNTTQPRFLVDMLPEVYSSSSESTLRALLSRKSVSERDLAGAEERGSAYIAEVNAFYIREFQMMSVAEDAARFLHQACQGLPRRLSDASNEGATTAEPSSDRFFTRVIEHALAYFGSRVLYPSRPAHPEASMPLSRAACEKAAQSAVRAESAKFESVAQDWGYRIGTQIYDAYLAGKLSPSALRRLFLVHCDGPGTARKVCASVIAKLRGISRARVAGSEPPPVRE